MAEEEGYERRIASARRQGFSAGRKAGVWLAFNGPQAKAKARRMDVQAMRRQDVALEGIGDVFGRAERQANLRDAIRRMRIRQAQQAPPAPVLAQQVFAPPAPAPAPAPPAQRIKLTPENASNYIGRTVFFTSGGQQHSATISRVSPSGLAVQGGPPSIRNSLSFKGRVLLV